ncbi:MAG TPA: ATP-binding cassette domain-containing protein [Candidatus Yaniella excrementavium]|nr:ATP-binding cassette domain-containing protein [Candidatus Yaniella excrementavium]
MTTQATNLDVNLTVVQRNVDLTFSVPEGQTLALLGSNGSGKTTTLLALAGWLIPDSGHARLADTVLFDCPAPAAKPRVWVPAVDRGIGYLSQNHHLFPHLSAHENIMYGMDRAGIVGRKARKGKAAEWLERVGLAGYGKRKPGQLSGGQAQRVAIARVLASGPRLVLLDEPLAALDVEAAPAIRQLLAEVLTDHTVVLVTHHQNDVDALADRVHHIDPQGPTRPTAL